MHGPWRRMRWQALVGGSSPGALDGLALGSHGEDSFRSVEAAGELAVEPGVHERREPRRNGVEPMDADAAHERTDRHAAAEVDPNMAAATPDDDIARAA